MAIAIGKVSIGTCLGLVVLALASVARADTVSISIPSQVSGSIGSTITVFGSLTNTTSNTEYFGNDSITLTAPGTVATAQDDLIFNGLLGDAPVSIAPGATLTNVDLFSIQFLGGTGTYTGNTFQLLGGTDSNGCVNSSSDCATLGTASFALTPVPLPGAIWLMISGLVGLATWANKFKVIKKSPAMHWPHGSTMAELRSGSANCGR